MNKQRLVVGISGSSGAILGIRLLQALRSTAVETHLVITPSARVTIQHETAWSATGVEELAAAHYNPDDMAAPIASGSFDTLGMVVIPCSIKSLSAVANSYSADLLARAADVTLKEGRPLVLVVREAPIHAGHIDLMRQAARSGAILFPPVPAFYTYPQSVDEIVDNIVGRVLRRMGIANELYGKWGEAKGDQGIGTEAPRQEPMPPQEPMPWEETEPWIKAALMVLATVGADGAPHASPVHFTADEDQRCLYFISPPDSPLSRDLARSPLAAAGIPAGAERTGVALRGMVRAIPPGEEWEQAWARYLVKFPFEKKQMNLSSGSMLYAFHPDGVRPIDRQEG